MTIHLAGVICKAPARHLRSTWETAMETRPRKLNKDVLFPSIIIFSILILLLFVCPFSPIYRYCFETDEISYRLVAKGLLKGNIPYRDIFDHKGPLLYFVYALGLLISGGHSFGIWIVFSLINAASFYLLYKTARLFFDAGSSFCGVMLTIALLFLHRNSLFDSGSKPEHVILLLLIASEYLFLRRFQQHKHTLYPASKTDLQGEKNSAQTETSSLPQIFSGKDMLVLGLFCGAVFLLKANYCIYYLSFLGMFFLYLLAKKHFQIFLKDAAFFLLGIALILLPFALFFLVHGALSNLIRDYFIFNLRYTREAGFKLFYFRRWIQFPAKLAVNILFALAIAAFTSAFLKAKEGSPMRKALFACLLCALVTVGCITLPLIYRYALATLVPILVFGPCALASALKKRLPKWHLTAVIPCLCAVLLLNFLIRITAVSALIPREKPPLEIAMDRYSEAFPDATYMYYGNLCHSFFYDLTSAVPDFKYFYAPNFNRGEIIEQQAESIRAGQPDVLAYLRTEDMDDIFMEELRESFATCGYEFYTNSNSNNGSSVYVYIRKAHFDKLLSS